MIKLLIHFRGELYRRGVCSAAIMAADSPKVVVSYPDANIQGRLTVPSEAISTSIFTVLDFGLLVLLSIA
jgi:hypothetical protein